MDDLHDKTENGGIGRGNSVRNASREFEVRIPARFFKDASISMEAKALLPIVAAHADSKTRQTYVSNRTLLLLMRCGRGVLERALRELCGLGWLSRSQRVEGGRWGRRTLTWHLGSTRRSKPPQRLLPPTEEQATSHTPSEVKSPEKKVLSHHSPIDAQNPSIGSTVSDEESDLT